MATAMGSSSNGPVKQEPESSINGPVKQEPESNKNDDDHIEYPYCEVDKYEKLTKIAHGTFGEVFKARHRQTNQIVALKKVLMENEKEGLAITANRQIKILQSLKHENVVNLIEIYRNKKSKTTVFLAFDFCEHDLAGLISNINVKFNLAEIKKVMQQLLKGLYFIHQNRILHQDMQPSNILFTNSGVLKLAYLGLATTISPNTQSLIKGSSYTNPDFTLWYRPPELLLGDRNYGPPVDLWGAGCIMAEMWTRAPIMIGSTEQEQLDMITQLCGSISPETWPGVDKLDLFSKLVLQQKFKRKVKQRLKHYIQNETASDLIDKLLILNPNQRLDTDGALKHEFFYSDPLPKDLGPMLSLHKEMLDAPRRVQPPKRLPNRPPSGHVPHRKRHRGDSPDGQLYDRVF